MVSQAHRDEEKLGLILGQLGKVRRRLNSLAIQRGVFESLALAVGTAALVFGAAMLLGPLEFIAVAALLGAVLFLGVAGAVRRAWRMHADPDRAATLADLRAGLKGRLATIVALTREGRRRGPLWSYLLEDTLALREEFTAARIERRRVSPSLYAFLLYCVLAALVVPLAMLGQRSKLLANTPAEMELDVNDLDVRPASPDTGAEVDVSGDSTAMRKLADKLARSGDAQEGQAGTLGKLMGQA
ncbi:MAG: magnesium transporter, partial [Candidatus Binataceae bacterium]